MLYSFAQIVITMQANKNTGLGQKMATVKIISAALAGVLLMSGCAATAGNQKLGSMEKSQLNSQIVKGVSTKKDVETLLGQPGNVTPINGGTERWTYSFARASLKPANYIPLVNMFYRGTNNTGKAVVVDFDTNDVVKEMAVNESVSETKQGLFQ